MTILRVLKVIAYSFVVLAVLIFIYIALVVIDIKLTKSNCNKVGYEFGIKYVDKEIKVYSYGCVKLAISYLEIDIYLDTVNKENYYSVYLIDQYKDDIVIVADSTYIVELDTLLGKEQPELIEVYLSGTVCAVGGIGVWPLNCTHYRCMEGIAFTSDSVMLCREAKKPDI